MRLRFPIDAAYFGMKPAYFPSYLAMFVLGMVAWRNRWLDAIPDVAFRWARLVVVASVIGISASLLSHAAAASAGSATAAAAQGGPHVLALVQAFWEQLVLVGMSIVLLRWGQRRLNRPSRLWQAGAASSYLAYIIQPLVLVPLAMLLRGESWPALVKFGVVGLLAVPTAYGLARALRLIRPVREVVG